jgi:two-component system, sensor histidine kinase
MLGNIVQNAVRYTVEGSVRINVTPHDAMLRIAVSDTGPGIANEDLSRIWQEFEQLHNPERDRRQGLGLGLAIVRRLSRILNHPVNVTSLPGQGTTFTIELPRAEPVVMPATQTQARPPKPATTVPDGAHVKMAVVVEDDPPLLAVLGMILEDHGWTVVAAADTNAALAQLRETPRIPEIILTDYRLRDGKLGTAAIAAIRGQMGRAIPAIILTGDVSGTEPGAEGPLRDADRLGDVTVLRKPVAAAELANAMNRATIATAG